ncbi:MAG: glutamate synthase subunit alpha, partial [Saprospiraceae bacterium]
MQDHAEQQQLGDFSPYGKTNAQKGLYVPQAERDSCGTGLIANLKNNPSHKLVEDALTMLVNMEHRGACGYEPNTGDGAGILIQTPHRFFLAEAERMGFELPALSEYGVGMLFLPKEKELQDRCLATLKEVVQERDFELLGIRPVPVNSKGLGKTALSTEPDMVQVFVKHNAGLSGMELERKLYILRKNAARVVHQEMPFEQLDLFYFASFSNRTIVYKGQLTTWQVRNYFLDLQDEKLESAIALIHSRFSTNTVPKWKLAQPFRYIA